MKKSTAWIAALALGLLVALPTVAAAQEEPGGDGVIAYLLAHPGVLARQLRLTPEQVTATRRLIQSTRETLRPLRASIGSLTGQIQEALAQPSPDACAVGQLVVDRHGKYEQIEAALEGFDDAFSALLTPDQLTKYEALKERLRRGPREP